MTIVKTELVMEATGELKEQVEKELEIADPTPEEALAKLSKEKPGLPKDNVNEATE